MCFSSRAVSGVSKDLFSDDSALITVVKRVDCTRMAVECLEAVGRLVDTLNDAYDRYHEVERETRDLWPELDSHIDDALAVKRRTMAAMQVRRRGRCVTAGNVVLLCDATASVLVRRAGLERPRLALPSQRRDASAGGGRRLGDTAR